MPRVVTRAVINFLLEGDPAIRWQVMRDLLDTTSTDWENEQILISSTGWGAKFLARQHKDGSWPVARWTDAVWTLQTLVDLGIPPNNERLTSAAERLIGRLMPKGGKVSHKVLATRMDLCHLGFWLRIGAYFLADDARLESLSSFIYSLQMEDGGWNCRIIRRRLTHHSSFHTTFNVLEGLSQAANLGVIPMKPFLESQSRALEFMMEHQMYRSDNSGEIINRRFIQLTYPWRWHYTVLRGLDYMRNTPQIFDPRLEDALSVVEGQMNANGLWPVANKIEGDSLFDMEKMGKDSRWNTLRALRVLKAAGRIVIDQSASLTPTGPY